MNKLTVIDLFSGAGGFSLAACNQGLKLIAAVEQNKDACNTFYQNIVATISPQTQLFQEDICTLSPAKMLNEVGLKQGELNLLIGGPPCQGFSSHRIKGTGIDDPKNQLLIRYFDFVNVFRPQTFLVENVPGLLWKRHEFYLEKFKSLAKKSNYTLLGPVKLNAKDYGVPQNRNRVFILGIRDDIDISALKWPPQQTHYKPGLGLPEWRTASTIFEKPSEEILKKLENTLGTDVVKKLCFGNNLSQAEIDPCAIHMQHSEKMVERFELTPINGGRKDIDFRLPCHEKGYEGHTDVYGRIRLAQPGPTITTGCFNPSKGRFLHPWKNYGITIRHAARFQTFPDHYLFSGGITSQGIQVGNAVPIALGEVLIGTIAKSLQAQCLKTLAKSS